MLINRFFRLMFRTRCPGCCQQNRKPGDTYMFSWTIFRSRGLVVRIPADKIRAIFDKIMNSEKASVHVLQSIVGSLNVAFSTWETFLQKTYQCHLWLI